MPFEGFTQEDARGVLTGRFGHGDFQEGQWESMRALLDGKDALVVMRTRMKVAPASIAVLGADDNQNSFTMLYSDERGVVRRLEMTLTARRWTMIRRQRGFSQRFVGRIAPNGRSIRATWDKSADGRRWIRDFELVYTKRR